MDILRLYEKNLLGSSGYSLEVSYGSGFRGSWLYPPAYKSHSSAAKFFSFRNIFAQPGAQEF